MVSKKVNTHTDTIDYIIGVAICGPIVSGDYEVENTTINVSYPSKMNFGLPTPIEVPKGISTVFRVTWIDKSGISVKKLKSKKHERFHPIHIALEKINELLIAFKLVLIGHPGGSSIRTIGLDDTLFHYSLINRQHIEI